MGYVVEDAVLRARATFGVPDASDWERFIARIGLVCVEDDLPFAISAMIVDRTIIVQRGLGSRAKAMRVWHETAHWFLHVGSMNWWISRPQGNLTVSRFERQAREFASLFPAWEGE